MVLVGNGKIARVTGISTCHRAFPRVDQANMVGNAAVVVTALDTPEQTVRAFEHIQIFELVFEQRLFSNCFSLCMFEPVRLTVGQRQRSAVGT